MEMRQRLARESFEEKIHKAGQLIHLAKEFPRQPTCVATESAAAAKEKTIIYAIRNRKLLEFSYNSRTRIVEPQSYGLSKKTNQLLMRGYQRAGGSVSGYTRGLRLFDVAKISSLRQTGERFAKAQPAHNPNDSAMSKVILSLPLSHNS